MNKENFLPGSEDGILIVTVIIITGQALASQHGIRLVL